MTYAAFKEAVRCALAAQPEGLTWKELRAQARLPYDRPCPDWTKRLASDIGLIRRARRSRALVWQLSSTPPIPARSA